MKRLATLTVVLLCHVPGPHELSAQSLLSQLEQRLPSGSAPPATPGSTAPRGYLGAKLDNADEQGKTGVRVTEVVSGAPAESGGLKAGDLITAINGKPVANLAGYDVVADGPAGTRLQMTVDRAGKKVPVTVTLGTKPAAPPTAASPPSIPSQTSEPQLGAPSLSPPSGAPPAGPPTDSTLPRSTFPRSSPSSSTAPASEPPALPAPSFGSVPPASEPSPALPSTLPTPGLTDRGPDSTPGGIRAQPLDLASPPSATIGDGAPPALGSTPPASTSGNASIGISVLPLTDQTRQRLNIPVRRGALIDSVRSLSPADQAGLPVDAVIVRFDDRPIESDQDLINAVRAARPGQEVEIAYYEGSRLSRKVLTLAAAPSAGSVPPPTGYSDSGLGQAPGAAPPGGPTAPRTGRPGGGLLSRIDRMADNMARPQSTMTVWDPLAMASMQARVEELTKTVNSLQERIRTLESKLGVTQSPTANP